MQCGVHACHGAEREACEHAARAAARQPALPQAQHVFRAHFFNQISSFQQSKPPLLVECIAMLMDWDHKHCMQALHALGRSCP